MERALLNDMVCPYCNGAFTVASEVKTATGRLDYALVECRCFKFPIVEGILLLSLAKGYGGAEEELQPYVPLQVAAIELLERGDVQGLRAWIRRHIPLATDIANGSGDTYVQFCSKMASQLESAETSYLIRQGRYESVGFPGRTRFKALAEGVPKGPFGLGRYPTYVRARQLHRLCRRLLWPAQYELKQLANFYAWRFFAPRTNALAMQLQWLPMEGRVLSLCCGQGVFENLVTARTPLCNIISIDGQFLNLLATKHYVNPNGTYICHDLQMPLPFRDRYFDGVFSSTCLPEIPPQKSFVTESIRVTRDGGWTLFDSIWASGMDDSRINHLRHYRFAQNFFSQLSDYSRLFSECANSGREVAVGIPAAPDAYLKAPGWISGKDRIEAAIQQSTDSMLSALIMAPDRLLAAQSTIRPPWLMPEKLYVSPVFSVRQTPRREVQLESRPWLSHPPLTHAPRAFKGYPATEVLRTDDLKDPEFLLHAFCRGLLVLLPRAFGDEPRRLSVLL
jgi:SAM-dependent methyltransferase/uncharacterized protein YbaR (Trm112 family)